MGRDPPDLHLLEQRPPRAGKGVAALHPLPGAGETGRGPCAASPVPLGGLGPEPTPTRGPAGPAPALQQCRPGRTRRSHLHSGTAPTVPPEPCAAEGGRPRCLDAGGPAEHVPAPLVPPAPPGGRGRGPDLPAAAEAFLGGAPAYGAREPAGLWQAEPAATATLPEAATAEETPRPSPCRRCSGEWAGSGGRPSARRGVTRAGPQCVGRGQRQALGGRGR